VLLINEIRAAKLGQTDKAKSSRGGENEYSSRKSDRTAALNRNHRDGSDLSCCT